MENLKIPYGLDDKDKLVAANQALKGESYRCPQCKTSLVFRSGEYRAAHFAHAPESHCSLESILHITAKGLILEAMSANASGNAVICLENHCECCGVVFATDLPSGTFTDAKLEVRIGDFICDVVGYRSTNVALAVEIFNTHSVDANKATNLEAYWVELKAEDVLRDPFKWVPTQARLKNTYCTDCKTHLKDVVRLCDHFNIDRSLYSAIKDPKQANYIADIEVCFRCHEKTPVFWWYGVPFCEHEPPSPKPATIQYRHSKKYGGSYWANTCACCYALQGDNFLFLFDNAPFKGLPLSHESSDNSRQTGNVKIVTGNNAAMSEMMKVIKRNFG